VSHLGVYEATIEGGDLRAGDDAADARFFPLAALPTEIAFKTHRRALSDWLARYHVMASAIRAAG
jgi:ADP-ribose pyrophosphatase YjhB (NUDIX family)